MSEFQAIVWLFIFGLISLGWGLHGVLNRRKFNASHFRISLAQIMGGIFSLIGVIIYYLQHK